MRPQQISWKRKLALKFFVCAGLGFVALIAILALAPSEPIWTTTKRQLEARGEVLDWEKFIPPAIPPEENIIEHPMAASLLPLKGKGTTSLVMPSHPPGTDYVGVPYAVTNLAKLPRTASSDELSLAELDQWFDRYDEAFAQLRDAGQRPKVVWPGDYSLPINAPMPNFVAIRTLAQVLVSRAKVHLVIGESSAALEDLDALSVVIKSLRSEPATIVTAMIHVAVAGLYTATVEEGLRHNLWREDELRKLVPRLREIKLLPALAKGIRAERAAILRHLTALAQRRTDPLYQETTRLFGWKDWTVERLVINFSPPHWIRRNQADYAKLVQGYLDCIDLSGRTIDLEQVDRINAEVTKLNSGWRPKAAILVYILPNLSKAFATVARTQTSADRLVVACAVELYKRKNNRYPGELGELVPEYLANIPNDIYTGKPMNYARREQGYELMSRLPQLTDPGDGGSFLWKGE